MGNFFSSKAKATAHITFRFSGGLKPPVTAVMKSGGKDNTEALCIIKEALTKIDKANRLVEIDIFVDDSKAGKDFILSKTTMSALMTGLKACQPVALSEEFVEGRRVDVSVKWEDVNDENAKMTAELLAKIFSYFRINANFINNSPLEITHTYLNKLVEFEIEKSCEGQC